MLDWLRRDHLEPTVEIDGVALPIAIRRHPTAKRVVLRIAPDGSEARVTLPRWGRTADAIEFAHSRAAWLTEQLAALPKPSAPVPGGSLRYCGDELIIDWQAGARRRPTLGDGRVVIGGPEENIAPRLQRWLEREALHLLEGDLQNYCASAGVAAPALRLSRAQRRWGSCSSSGTVRINWRLVQAPHFVRRSVVAHEVAHLLHFDHGPAFHAALGRIFDGDLAAANRWLKREGRTLYASFG
ncbi:SprT family zinc-dependent metalloprotease [Allopontixanthobacter sp.]|uniref:M48 family metallopeptidase n=1 Tax=Allopontixanthobacter sp. TaxID=2906452 RepID=UPI002ABC0207|nr:SprT family zinc-dependent metalloprotease [Allopontixanthobacter sp.]MDZ4306684.1 SprT family zinc-dependent metalloprotease [Allopontixanthobacter sp.]